MKHGLHRRGFLVGLGALAVVPSVVRGRTTLPEGQFELERVLRRGLADGQEIAVTRRWTIDFSQAANGQVAVSGTQSFAAVDAPPALEALARIEEQRVETGLFPMLLDEGGHIATGPEDGSIAPIPQEAVSSALDYARQRAPGPDPAAASRRFLADLSQHGDRWLTLWPSDLFFPVPRDRTARKDMTLPDGTQGVVSMRESASVRDASGLLERYLREATTSTATMTRKGSESWTLAPTVS